MSTVATPIETIRARDVRAVLLDAGNTLLFERPSRFDIYHAQAVALGLDADAARVRRAMSDAHDRIPWVAGERVRYTDAWFREYVPAVFGALGASGRRLDGLTDAMLRRFRETAVFSLYPETLETLDALKARGLRLGVVSNWSPRLALHLDSLGLSPYFDTVLISAVVGLEKPAPSMFERACAALGVRPEQAVHVGDHPIKDCAGARAAGVHALLIDRDGGPELPGIISIRNLRDVLAWLDGVR